jgi:hypothetical protein
MTMWDCVLSDRHREQYEQAIRDVIVMSARREGGKSVVRHVPPKNPNHEGYMEGFNIDAMPGLLAISIQSRPQDRAITAQILLDAVPEGATVCPRSVSGWSYEAPEDWIPAEWADKDVEDWPAEEGAELSNLAALSDRHARLSESLLATLASHIAAPASEARVSNEKWWPDGRRFAADSFGPEMCDFGVLAKYSESVEQVYAEGRQDIAQQLGLPL